MRKSIFMPKLKLTKESAKDLGMVVYKNRAWEVDHYLRHRWPDRKVKGDLDLSGMDIETLPDGLEISGKLNLERCKSLVKLSSNLKVSGDLNLTGCDQLKSLPSRLEVGGALHANYTSIEVIPSDLKVGCELWMTQNESLTTIEQGFKVGGRLDLMGCSSLMSVPQGLNINGDFILAGCNLRTLPQDLVIQGSLDVSHCKYLEIMGDNLRVGKHAFLTWCVALKALPFRMTVGKSLFLNGCNNLKSLPQDLIVQGDLDVSRCRHLANIDQDDYDIGGVIYYR
jgi:hypothetical protein